MRPSRTAGIEDLANSLAADLRRYADDDVVPTMESIRSAAQAHRDAAQMVAVLLGTLAVGAGLVMIVFLAKAVNMHR